MHSQPQEDITFTKPFIHHPNCPWRFLCAGLCLALLIQMVFFLSLLLYLLWKRLDGSKSINKNKVIGVSIALVLVLYLFESVLKIQHTFLAPYKVILLATISCE